MKHYLPWLLMLTIACTEQPTIQVNRPAKGNEDLDLLTRNKEAVAMEQRDIENYVRRNGINPTSTGSGLHIQLVTDEQGPNAEPEQEVLVDYRVELLNGKVCYSSAESGPQQFVVEHDHVESGLHEGIQHMSVGDSALIIIPSYLAHGLIGDQDKIPMRSTVVFHLKVLGIR